MRTPLLSLLLIVCLSGCQLSPDQNNSRFIGPRKTLSLSMQL